MCRGRRHGGDDRVQQVRVLEVTAARSAGAPRHSPTWRPSAPGTSPPQETPARRVRGPTGNPILGARSPARSTPRPVWGSRSPSPGPESPDEDGPAPPAHPGTGPPYWPSSTSATCIHRLRHDSLIERSLAICAIGLLPEQGQGQLHGTLAERRRLRCWHLLDSFPRGSSPQDRCPETSAQLTSSFVGSVRS